MTKIQQDLTGKLEFITTHWSASSYSQVFSHYHFCVNYNPITKKAGLVQTLSLYTKGSHTWHRNTGNIGVSMMAEGRDASGKLCPVQMPQVELAAKLIAELCIVFNMNIDNVHGHVYWAAKDGYGPGSGNPETRVDPGKYEEIIHDKAKWYMAKLKSGEAHFEYTNNLH